MGLTPVHMQIQNEDARATLASVTSRPFDHVHRPVECHIEERKRPKQ